MIDQKYNPKYAYLLGIVRVFGFPGPLSTTLLTAPLCSFMTGRRPSKTKVWNFIDHFREPGVGANWTSMPQWFKEHGYFTHALGKLFHPGNPPNFDPPSWSDPGSVLDNAGQVPTLPNVTARRSHAQTFDISAVDCISGEPGGSWCEINGTAGPDDALAANSVASVKMLAEFSKRTGTPFFLGVGFHKPHIPWTIPERFFSGLPSIPDTALPAHENPPTGMPPIAWNKGLGTHALDSYKDTNLHPLHAFANGSSVSFPHLLTKAMRRAYYAAVRYTDHNIGLVLEALQESAIADNTVVAVMGDHGYNLGELNLWCKMTVFESGTRVPFMLRAPRLPHSKGQRTSQLVEAVDLFPSLVDLAAGVAPPSYADGMSVKPLLLSPSATVALKPAAYSEFVKCYSCCRVPDDQACHVGGTQGRCAPKTAAGLADLSEMGNCFDVPREHIDFIGYSLRTAHWRFTEWLHFNGTTLHGDFNRPPVGRELYDHAGDVPAKHNWNAYENENVVDDPGNKDTVARLHQLLLDGFGTA